MLNVGRPVTHVVMAAWFACRIARSIVAAPLVTAPRCSSLLLTTAPLRATPSFIMSVTLRRASLAVWNRSSAMAATGASVLGTSDPFATCSGGERRPVTPTICALRLRAYASRGDMTPAVAAASWPSAENARLLLDTTNEPSVNPDEEAAALPPPPPPPGSPPPESSLKGRCSFDKLSGNRAIDCSSVSLPGKAAEFTAATVAGAFASIESRLGNRTKFAVVVTSSWATGCGRGMVVRVASSRLTLLRCCMSSTSNVVIRCRDGAQN